LAVDDEVGLLVCPGERLETSHRHFSHLMAIHPLGLIDPADGEAAQAVIDRSLAHLDRLGPDYWCGYTYSWLASLRARAGDGAGAAETLRIFSQAFCLRNSFHANGDQTKSGLSRYHYRPFTLEGNFAAAQGVQEMLLQSHRGIIRLFPAIPAVWAEVSFRSLRAEGAVLVSAERRGGQVAWLELTAEQDRPVRVELPWTGAVQEVALRAGQPLRLSAEVRTA
jgi:hypothetical protein